jgi:hypothetical protein
VQSLTFQRDFRALAASSTAIAFSIGSPIYDTGDASNDGATVRGKDTGWQTAYAAARMAVEVTKESSDMFLPLKAVASAMSVLIKNYDVSVTRSRTKRLLILCRFPLQQASDNAENMKEIERRVHSLSGVLASPVSKDDYAEKGRRVALQRSVLVWIHISLLTPLSGSSRGLSRSSNHSPTNMRL